MLGCQHFVSGVSSVHFLSPAPALHAQINGTTVFSTTRLNSRNAVSGTRASLKIDDEFGAPAFGSVEVLRSKRVALCNRTRAGNGLLSQVVSTKEPIPLMLVTDLDFTMVDHEDRESRNQIRFNSLWAADYAHNSLLVFSTGRSPEKYEQLRKEKPLLTPNIGIFSVGTEILYGSSLESDVGWEDYLNDGWNRDFVVKECQNFPALRFQEDSEQRPHKVSFYVEKDLAPGIIRELTQKMKDLRLKVTFIYSGGYALDILPHRAGKGKALAYLLEQLKKKNMTPKATLVCGDSGNDAELYTVEGVKGVIVGNAMDELLQWYDGLQVKKHIFKATQRCAGGIVEAIEHFALGPYEVPADRVLQSQKSFPMEKSNAKPTKGSATREIVDVNTALLLWANGDCPKMDAVHNRILCVMAEDGTMVYPWGEERILKMSVNAYKGKHGLKKDAKLQVWMDCMKEQKLADNIFLVTWQYWQQLTTGENRRGYYATAILRTKVGNPNGLEWVRVHETPRSYI